MRKRCFSKCRGLTRSNCSAPCTIVNEQYCRLSSTLKMIPPDCHVVKRDKHVKPISQRRSQNRSRRRFDDSFCLDSGLCKKKSSTFFKFKDFTYAVSIHHEVIHYQRNNLSAYATLKSCEPNSSEPNLNLAYECLAGQFLNEMSKKTPCWLETYGLFLYPDKQQRNLIQKNSHINLASSLIPILPEKYAAVCSNPELECLLIQHIQAKPLAQFVKNPHFFIHDALYVFYQVYFTLSMLRKVFTHYDLNCQNVLLYEPLSKGYIEYHYHLPKEIVRFHSFYLVKLKNYGKCFFKGSSSYLKQLQKEPRCSPLEKHGFYEVPKNESQDLSLFKDYQRSTRMKTHTNPYIRSFVQVFEDIQTNPGTETRHSTTGQISTVSEAEKRLRSLIQDPVRQRINQLSYSKYQKLGELHVYTNGKELEFIS